MSDLNTSRFDGYGGEADVWYRDDEATKELLFNEVLAFFKKHDSYSGESIMQTDAPQQGAPELLADIADNILCFDIEWKLPSD